MLISAHALRAVVAAAIKVDGGNGCAAILGSERQHCRGVVLSKERILPSAVSATVVVVVAAAAAALL